MAETLATQRYYHYSEKASEIVRATGFAGLATIWIFHQEIDGKAIIPKELAFAGMFIVLGLASDLFHYVAKSLYWAYATSHRSESGSVDEEASKVSLSTFSLLVFTFGFMLTAYGILVYYLATHTYVLRPHS